MEKADSSSVLPCPVSISTKNKMNFLFANLKDRDFLVQRISDFLQRTPDSSDTGPLSLTGHSVCHSFRSFDQKSKILKMCSDVTIVCVKQAKASLQVLLNDGQLYNC